MSVYDEWMSEYDEWMREYDKWMSVYDEWMSVYGEWMQWVLGVCKDMNVDCWVNVGVIECKYNCFVTLSIQTIVCDDMQHVYVFLK